VDVRARSRFACLIATLFGTKTTVVTTMLLCWLAEDILSMLLCSNKLKFKVAVQIKLRVVSQRFSGDIT
jgi:hypothetical protein